MTNELREGMERIGFFQAHKTLAPLTIVYIDAQDRYGVIIEQTDHPTEEYRVQPVSESSSEYGNVTFTAELQGLYRRDEIAAVSFCENDNLQAFILCAAAGYPLCEGARRTGC